MSLFVSIIIPVFNVEQYLSECIASVVNQRYKDLEIILIDDGSTDNSGRICDEWAEKDHRIRVFHKEHGGVSEARNAGIKTSTGQLIGFVDSDDWLEPEMYELMVERLVRSDADAVMCGYYCYPGGIDRPVANGMITAKTEHLKRLPYY